MSHQMKSIFAAALLLVLVPLGMAEEEPDQTGPQPTAVKTCFNVRDARSFGAVDDRFVYVRGVRDQHYLLTMDNACFGLQNSIKVAVSSGFNRVCSNDRAAITYRDFDRIRRCGVLLVEEVASRDEALKLIEQRKKDASGGDKGK